MAAPTQGGAPVAVAGLRRGLDAEHPPEPGGQPRRPRGHPRGHPGEPDAEQEHDHGDRQHQHPGHPGGQAHRRPEGAEQRAEDAEADDAPGVEGELGPHPRRERQTCPAAGGVGGGVRGGETEHQAPDHGHAGRHAGGDTQDEHEEQPAAARVGHPRQEVGRAEDGEGCGERRHGERRDRHGSPHRPVAGQPGCGARFVAGGADRGVEQVAVQGRVTAHGRRAASGRHAHGPHAGHRPERLGDPPLAGGARHPRDGNGERNGGSSRRSSCSRSASRCVPAGPIIPPPGALIRVVGPASHRRDAQNRFQRSATA